MKLVSQGNALDDSIAFMEDKTTEAIEHMNIVKGEEKQQEQKEDVEDQAIF